MHTPPPSSRKRHHAWLCACVLTACAGAATAQEEDGERSWDLGIALGYGERSNPLINGETIDINAVLDFSWYGKRFFFDNGDLGYTLFDDSNWSVSLIATVNNERNYYNYLSGRDFGLNSLLNSRVGIASLPGLVSRTSSFDSMANSPEGFTPEPDIPSDIDLDTLNRRTELADRDFALNSGLEFLYISPWGDLQAQVLTDISSRHDGQEAWLSWSKPWYTRTNEFTLTLGLEWKSSNLVSYYYGVREDEAFGGRDFYESGSGSNTFIRFAARHAFSEHWNIVAMVEREFLSKAISASPIVDETAVDTFFAGLLYQF